MAHADFENAEDAILTINKLQVEFRAFTNRLDDRKKILVKTLAFHQSGLKVSTNKIVLYEHCFYQSILICFIIIFRL